MIRFDIILSFPLGVRFDNNPKVLFYKKLIQMIRNISCLNNNKQCLDCPFSSNCIYYMMVGKYPSVLIDTKLIEKMFYKTGQQLELKLYLIGNSVTYCEYISVFFKEFLKQKICGAPFYIIKFEKNVVDDKDTTSAKHLKIESIIEDMDITKVINNQINYYKDNYGIELIFENSIVTSSKFVKRTLQDGNRLLNGYIGDVYFDSDIRFSKVLTMTGIGKYCHIGGGKIEIKN